MAVEKYIAAASMGLFIMFAGEIITIYNFMINPITDIFEPEPKMLQFISIGVAPASILAGVSYILSRRYGSRPIGAMILAGGIVLMAAMAVTYVLVDDIQEQFKTPSVTLAPIVFMVVSIPVMAVGLMLFRVRKRRTKKNYL